MFGAATVSIVIVVYLWFAYFNTIVPNAVPTAASQAPATSASDTSGPGIFGLFADAASSWWQTALQGMQGAASALKNPKQYNINPR